MSRKSNRSVRWCLICGDRAYGINFSVLSCLSCKAFFRRNAFRDDSELLCPFNENCQIDPSSRKFCTKCRLRKCLQCGMKKELILSDEEKQKLKEKINQNKLRKRQQQQQQAQQGPKHLAELHHGKLPQGPTDGILPQTTIKLPKTSKPEQTTSLKTALVPPFDQPIHHHQQQQQQQQQQQRIGGMAQHNHVSSSSNGFENGFNDTSPNYFISSNHLPTRTNNQNDSNFQPELMIDNQNFNHGHPFYQNQDQDHLLQHHYQSMSQLLPLKRLPPSSDYPDAFKEFDEMISMLPAPVTHCPLNSSQEVKLFQPGFFPNIEGSNHHSSSSYHHVDGLNGLQPVSTLEVATLDHSKPENLFKDLRLTNQLLFEPNLYQYSADALGFFLSMCDRIDQTNKTTFGHHRDDHQHYQPTINDVVEELPDLSKSQRSLIKELQSSCLLLRNPYTKMVYISDKQHLRTKISHQCDFTEFIIKRMIRMSKQLSMFRCLIHQDQRHLLKAGLIEMFALRSVLLYDPDREAWAIVDDNCKLSIMINFHVFKPCCIKYNFKEIFDLFMSLFRHEWKTDPLIFDLMTAIILLTPRPKTIENEKITNYQHEYVKLMEHYLKYKYPESFESESVGNQLINIVQIIQSVSSDLMHLFVNLNRSQPVGPLFIELLDEKHRDSELFDAPVIRIENNIDLPSLLTNVVK